MPLILATPRREDSSIFVLSCLTRTASAAPAWDRQRLSMSASHFLQVKACGLFMPAFRATEEQSCVAVNTELVVARIVEMASGAEHG